MEHPYLILLKNLSKYTNKLKKEDIIQRKANIFVIQDNKFKTLEFLQDVQHKTGIAPMEHQYIGAKCADTSKCFKPYTVYGFDNVLFYIENKDY